MDNSLAQDVLIEVRNLSKRFETTWGTVHAVTNVSFNIPRGTITGLVGESGSGKTTLGRALLRLIEPSEGQTIFDGIDLNALDPSSLRSVRKRMQIIFQDPVSSLNPRMKVGSIIAEGLRAHGIESSKRRKDTVAALLEEVGLSTEAMHRFPHEFSGGQRQRIGIARALALEPEFIVADESVSALDVSIQAQILNLLLELRERRNLTMLFIAHDLSVVEYLCDQVVVMYLGHIAEMGSAQTLYKYPSHPYTQALLSAVPRPDPTVERDRMILTGDIPSPLSPPSGCVFRTRCPIGDDGCSTEIPAQTQAGSNHFVYCRKFDAKF